MNVPWSWVLGTAVAVMPGTLAVAELAYPHRPAPPPMPEPVEPCRDEVWDPPVMYKWFRCRWPEARIEQANGSLFVCRCPRPETVDLLESKP